MSFEKHFLDNLYKQCASSRADGVDSLFDVIPSLLGQRKFEVVNNIMRDIDLSRVHTSTMYSLVHLVSSYIHQLPEYRPLWQRCREEFARRGEPSKRIEDLFGKYENGWEDRLFDPNAPEPKYYDPYSTEKLDNAIARATELGDKDIIDYLTYYKAERLRYHDKDRKYRDLAHTLGDEEMRKRCIKSLREMADLLEKTTSCFPGIYYCDLPEDPLLKKTFIDSIEVTISYPWPG